jgi:hypothetical protein
MALSVPVAEHPPEPIAQLSMTISPPALVDRTRCN